MNETVRKHTGNLMKPLIRSSTYPFCPILFFYQSFPLLNNSESSVLLFVLHDHSLLTPPSTTTSSRESALFCFCLSVLSAWLIDLLCKSESVAQPQLCGVSYLTEQCITGSAGHLALDFFTYNKMF